MLKSYHKFLKEVILEKTNQERKNKIFFFSFWILIFFSLYSILTLFLKYPYKSEVKGFSAPLKPITINLELNKKINNDILVCFNDFCTNLDNNRISNIYSIKFNKDFIGFNDSKIKKIYLAYPDTIKNFKDSFVSMNLYNGYNSEFFNKNDFQKLNKKHFEIELEGNKTSYQAYDLNFSGNYKGKFNHICNLFLGLFYNWYLFIVPYFWLFCAFLIYLFNKDIFNFKSSKRLYWGVFSLIIFLGFLLRINEITYCPLWLDEIYTKTTAIKSFISTFKDPGNPPLFFILEYFISKINNSDFSLKLISLISGVLIIPLSFLIINKTDKKLSYMTLFLTFLASINTIFIYHSQEARGYSLSIFLSMAVLYFLFEYLKNNKVKNLVLFSIFSICAINEHYILAIFVFGNFIWGSFDFIEKISSKKTNLKEYFKFLGSNLIIFLSFVPYLLITFKNSLTSDFNSWIEPLSKNVFLYTINEYFINKYLFIFLGLILLINLILCFIPEKILEKINLKQNKKRQDLFIYLIYSLVFVIIVSSAISIYIKPIFHKRILLAVHGLLFLLECVSIKSVVEIIKENKISKVLYSLYFILLTSIYFLITHPMPLREIYQLSDFMNFIAYDKTSYDKTYELHAITNDRKEYQDNFSNLENINWHYVNTNAMQHIKNINKKDYIKGQKGVIYLHSMSADIETMSLINPRVKVYKTNSINIAKIIYD